MSHHAEETVVDDDAAYLSVYQEDGVANEIDFLGEDEDKNEDKNEAKDGGFVQKSRPAQTTKEFSRRNKI